MDEEWMQGVTPLEIVWGEDADYVVYGFDWPSRSVLMIPGTWQGD